ncbi:folylpolyglutamate synthase/dihydrofolate synthase family protein [uncultured Croceitalea sp.]|uniref:bifunctional folylpolyglutamate synthase/dihydrofolate synthase n=1 Tax=uncultured Croceitalea sp. TaxID=1798908 RepID=UPI0033062676
MKYKETLDWMFNRLPMYQQKGASAFKDKLDNIQNFADHLNNPEKGFKSIHVAGTNGKGSSSHMLASILQEAGYKVGLYTSPHLKDFRERIKINGKKVKKRFVQTFIDEHRAFLEYHELSFFEMTVGMAFTHFAQELVDIAIIEVGLGGRLDSTNIIVPEVSLITNIGYDHMQILGDTLEKIALEKAGIIKRNVPVVISERQPETEMIFNLIAHQKKSTVLFGDELDMVTHKTDLLGEYQKKNSKGVVACIQQLKGFEVSDKAIKKGLSRVVKNTGLLGRWQILDDKPLTVCDTAHNKESLQTVLEQVKQQKYRHLHIVLGFVNDKQVDDLVAMFPKEASYYFVKPNIPRGLDVKKLFAIALEHGLSGECFPQVSSGLEQAKKNAKKKDLIYVGGSTFVVAEVV